MFEVEAQNYGIDTYFDFLRLRPSFMIQLGDIKFNVQVSRLGGASLSLSFSLQSCIIEVEV
jgi:hypothetical protein